MANQESRIRRGVPYNSTTIDPGTASLERTPCQVAPAALLVVYLTSYNPHTQIPLLSLLQENDYHLVPRTSQPAFSLSPLLHRRPFYCRSLSFFFSASRSLFRSLIRWSFFKLRQSGRRSLCILPSLHLLFLLILLLRQLPLS